jgi:hypothetical protein
VPLPHTGERFAAGQALHHERHGICVQSAERCLMSSHFRLPLLVLAAFTSLGALLGGVGLLVATDGHLLGWSVEMLGPCWRPVAER